MTNSSKPRRDVHAEITANIIAAIEANPGQPQMPWHRGNAPLMLPTNVLTGNAYQGINIVSLWVAQECFGYAQPVWGTYKQWAEKGCQVRKGEKASLVIFYKEYEAEPVDEDDIGKRRVAKASYAFNAGQVDGYESPAPPIDPGPIDRVAAADRFVTATGAVLHVGGTRAYYQPSSDEIRMPDETLFTGTASMNRSESYYAVLLHELTHWSGAEKRLNRNLRNRFGDEAYAMEELVAELGAAFLCAELGITLEPRADHAQYIAHWLEVLKSDDRAIFAAAAKASEAAKFLRHLQVGA